MAPDCYKPTLTTLPTHVLDQVVEAVLELDPRLGLTLLANCGTVLHAATKRVLARTLVLQDNDDILIEAEPTRTTEGGEAEVPDGNGNGTARHGRGSLLAQVLKSQSWASQVRSLQVTNSELAPSAATAAAAESALAGSPHEPVPPPPLHDAAFFLLISRLDSLTSLTWSSSRVPPEQLCLALGQATKNLTHFRLDLVPPSSSLMAWSPGSPNATSQLMASPVLGTSPTATMSSSMPQQHALQQQQHHHQRWDAPHLASLPDKLSSLSLSCLSQLGSRSLVAALAESTFAANLERLELAKTLFVDDQVLEAIGDNAKALQVLKVVEMGGTKLSEVGLAHVLNGCAELKELHLEAVEGRLTRTTWQKLTPLPPSLRTLRLAYSESGPHKSWVLDHFSSLASLLDPANSSLESLSLTRILPSAEAAVPGSHQLARWPIDALLEPRSFEDKALEALVEQGDSGGGGGGAREWRELELDLFKVDQDQLKRILEGCPKLRRLRVMFDGPFRNLLALAPAFAACPDLQHFLVVISPEHSSEMAGFTPTEYHAAVSPLYAAPSDVAANEGATAAEGEKATLPPASPAQSRRRGSLAPGSPSSLAAANKSLESDAPPSAGSVGGRSCVHHPLPALDALLPPTKDWRRFLKKAHALERVTWTGRGGLGKWDFSQKSGSSLAKVEFRPTKPVAVAAASTSSEEGMPGASGWTPEWSYYASEGGGSPTRTRYWTPSATTTASMSSFEGGLYGVGGTTTTTTTTRRRSSSVSLAGSCLSNLSLSPSSSPVSTLTSLATPISIGAASTSGRKGSLAGGLFDVPCSPPEYGARGTGHLQQQQQDSARRRSSASSASAFGAIGSGATALGLNLSSSMMMASSLLPSPAEVEAESRNGGSARDLFGWAADTAAAMAGESNKYETASSSQEHSGVPTPAASTATPPAKKPPVLKPLSFAAAVSSSSGSPPPPPQTLTPANGKTTAPAMARTTSASSSGALSASSASTKGSFGAGGGGPSGKGGSGRTSGGGRHKGSAATGSSAGQRGAGAGGGGSGGGQRSSRSKSSSPKQERSSGSSPKEAGAQSGGERRASGSGSASGTGSGAGSGSGGRRHRDGGRRREATK